MSIFLDTLHRESHTRPPVWFMRQAGRVLPSYNLLKEKHTFRELMRDPVLASKVTLLPVDDLKVDAAILFSDILVIPEALGMTLSFSDQGPEFSKPLAMLDQPHRYLHPNPDELGYIYQTITEIKVQRPQVPLIGFCGGPFTTLLYMLQGFSRKQEFPDAINFILSKPAETRQLITRITEMSMEYACKQVISGIDAFQLFDTHAGLLPFDVYKELFMPANRLILNKVREMGIPTLFFPKGIGAGIAHISPDDTDFLSIDWQTSIYDARKLVHPIIGLQGNIDPRILLCDKLTIEKHLQSYLEFSSSHKDWIVNLGHGVLPGTSLENAQFAISYIQTHFRCHA